MFGGKKIKVKSFFCREMSLIIYNFSFKNRFKITGIFLIDNILSIKKFV